MSISGSEPAEELVDEQEELIRAAIEAQHVIPSALSLRSVQPGLSRGPRSSLLASLTSAETCWLA